MGKSGSNGGAHEGPSVYEFPIDLTTVDAEILSRISEEIASIVTEKTPKGFLNNTGDSIQYELIVRLTHGSE